MRSSFFVRPAPSSVSNFSTVKALRVFAATLAACAGLLACTSEDRAGIATSDARPALRAQNEAERMADFEALASSLKHLYGPREYKERRFGFKLDELIAESREKARAATTDDEAFGVLSALLAKLQDGHVSIDLESRNLSAYNVPILLTPIEGKAVVGKVLDPTVTEVTGINQGDVVVEIDGKPTMSYLADILKYDSTGNSVTNQHLIVRALRRRTFVKELLPATPMVRLTIEKADGKRVERTLTWKMDESA